MAGEEAPVMGDVGPVTGVAKMNCNMTIPYKVEGEKQSDLEIFVEKDGKLLKIGKDINLTVHGDRVQLDVINPKRETPQRRPLHYNRTRTVLTASIYRCSTTCRSSRCSAAGTAWPTKTGRSVALK